jgi:hypothetical protein
VKPVALGFFHFYREHYFKGLPPLPSRKKQKQTKTRGVSNCPLAIYIKKYLKAKKEEL